MQHIQLMIEQAEREQKIKADLEKSQLQYIDPLFIFSLSEPTEHAHIELLKVIRELNKVRVATLYNR